MLRWGWGWCFGRWLWWCIKRLAQGFLFRLSHRPSTMMIVGMMVCHRCLWYIVWHSHSVIHRALLLGTRTVPRSAYVSECLSRTIWIHVYVHADTYIQTRCVHWCIWTFSYAWYMYASLYAWCVRLGFAFVICLLYSLGFRVSGFRVWVLLNKCIGFSSVILCVCDVAELYICNDGACVHLAAMP